MKQLDATPCSFSGEREPDPTRTAPIRAAIDRNVWERTMNRLRWMTLLMSAALTAVIARIVVDGPKLLVDLTGALLLLLLACSAAVTRYGRRLTPHAPSETERVDA